MKRVKNREQAPKESVRGVARAEDILKPADAKQSIAPELRGYYDRLLALYEIALAERQTLQSQCSEPMPASALHPAEAASDEIDHDLLLTQLAGEQDVIYEIEQALKRIESGTYGICEMTGRRIAKERLEAIPWTRFSLRAEQELEEEGHGHAVHLAPAHAIEGAGLVEGEKPGDIEASPPKHVPAREDIPRLLDEVPLEPREDDDEDTV